MVLFHCEMRATLESFATCSGTLDRSYEICFGFRLLFRRCSMKPIDQSLQYYGHHGILGTLSGVLHHRNLFIAMPAF
jgi:hypothetical protein